MFELSTDLPIVVSIGTLITLIGTIINYTSKVTAFKKKMEIKCEEIDLRLRKIEDLSLDARLSEISTDLKWIREKIK